MSSTGRMSPSSSSEPLEASSSELWPSGRAPVSANGLASVAGDDSRGVPPALTTPTDDVRASIDACCSSRRCCDSLRRRAASCSRRLRRSAKVSRFLPWPNRPRGRVVTALGELAATSSVVPVEGLNTAMPGTRFLAALPLAEVGEDAGCEGPPPLVADGAARMARSEALGSSGLNGLT